MSRQLQIFEFEKPDGSIIEIEAPSREAALTAFKRQSTSSTQPTSLQGSVPADSSIRQKTFKDTINDALFSGRDIVSGGTGIATGLGATALKKSAPAASLIGSGTMAIVNELISRYAGEKRPSPITGLKPSGNPIIDSPINILEDTLLNEGLGAIIGAPFKVGGRLINVAKEANLGPRVIKNIRDKAFSLFGSSSGKGSVVKDSITKLDPTYSQYEDSLPGTGFIEDVFAPGTKREAVERSGSLGIKEGQEIARKLTGLTGDINPADIANNFQLKAKANLTNSLNISNQRSEGIKLIAEGNILSKVVPGKPTASSIIGPNGKPIMMAGTPTTVNIAGPVPPTNTVTRLTALRDNITQSLDKPDPNNKLINSINNILDRLITVDATGKQIIDPVAFKTMWETKKDIGRKAFENVDNLPDFMRKGYREIYYALDQDIDDAMLQWKNGGQQAKQLWDEMKSGLTSTYESFYPIIEKGKKLRDVLHETLDPSPIMDDILSSPKKVQRALDSGNIQYGTTKVASDNMRKDLQGYAFFKTFKDSFKPLDPDEVAKGITNESKLEANWNIFINSEQGRKLFNQSNRADISQFIKDIKNIGPSGSSGFNRYMTLNLGRASVRLGAGVLAPIIGSQAGYLGTASAGAIVGATIGLHGLARLLTNPESARLIIAMQRGGPLDMSANLAGRYIVNALRNQPITIETQNGQQVAGRINSQGQFEQNK